MTLIKEIQIYYSEAGAFAACNGGGGGGRGGGVHWCLIVLKALNRERADKAEINASLRKSDGGPEAQRGDTRVVWGCGGGRGAGHTAFLHTALCVLGHNRIKKSLDSTPLELSYWKLETRKKKGTVVPVFACCFTV